jgi:hypothetical protein
MKMHEEELYQTGNDRDRQVIGAASFSQESCPTPSGSMDGEVDGGDAYTDAEAALVEGRLKNLGYL